MNYAYYYAYDYAYYIIMPMILHMIMHLLADSSDGDDRENLQHFRKAVTFPFLKRAPALMP